MNSLARFHEAQDAPRSGFATALAELQSGRKTSHWIWYIFPQLAGLGHSSTAKFYALADLAEARAYLADPILRHRLLAATEAVALQLASGARLTAVMGGQIDAQKLVSSLTLFRRAVLPDDALANAAERVLESAESQGFPPCELTLRSVKAS